MATALSYGQPSEPDPFEPEDPWNPFEPDVPVPRPGPGRMAPWLDRRQS